MTAFAEQSVAGKLNLGNSTGERNCNGHVIQQQRHCFESILAATTTTRKSGSKHDCRGSGKDDLGSGPQRSEGFSDGA